MGLFFFGMLMNKFLPFLLFLFSCVGRDPFVPSPVTKDVESCRSAETHLKELRCIPVEFPYTKRGKSFTQFCEETQNSGVYVNPTCLSHVSDCGEIDACFRQPE